MTTWDDFYGPNAGYAVELYERYTRDPRSVDEATRTFFERVAPPDGASVDGAGTRTATQEAAVRPVETDQVAKIVGAARLARGIREYGHLDARIDPLGTLPPGDPMLDAATHGLSDTDLAALPASIVWPEAGAEEGTCLDAISRLRAIYSGPLGYDFDHVQDFEERGWLKDQVEGGAMRTPLAPEERAGLLRRLTQVAVFERFLNSTFQGQKRFSIEGNDMLVPMLDAVIHDAAQAGAREVLIGMAHRGRLNVLAHVLGKPYTAIFSEFHGAPNKDLVPSEGSMGINFGWTGDVKYHLGAQRVVREGEPIKVTMADNPSHLEFVNPVIEGASRAAQDRRVAHGAPRQEPDRALAVVIHGDAAFPGEGVVAETLNLSRLPGYQTGGSVHVIVNNQVGFTTEARDGRSTLYASDLAKGFEIPIIHVNADDPEASLAAIRLAHAYRQRFHKDFLVDLVGYRRWGHNEGDEPAFTQPLIYARIAKHPPVDALYAKQLEAEQVVSAEDVQVMQREAEQALRAAFDALSTSRRPVEKPLRASPALSSVDSAVAADELRALNDALLARPEGFTPNPKLERLLQRRRERLAEDRGIDWGHAESLALASIVADGEPIRLSGQDTERGTFSQRHLVLHDVNTGQPFVPLQALPQARASFAVYNSPLSEAAVLGFEYGYSVHAPGTLVLWEAQFGDFANAGQVVIDQFIAAARAKWRQLPSLVLLLPHGYEGQGPEHSSGRVERYLQLAAEDNLRIVSCTTAAQYFHLLRAQAVLLGNAPRPLVVMTPKSLLRHPAAASSLADLANGRFQPVMIEPATVAHPETVERLLLCSGKIAVELAAARDALGDGRDSIAIVRVEQLYPFPSAALEEAVRGFSQLRAVLWVQEEPRNMGAWSFVAPRLEALLPRNVRLDYAGRPERASTAEGQAEVHAAEQARILATALGNDTGPRQAKREVRGGQHVG